VLDRDFFTVPDDEIRKIRSLLTVVGGKVAHNDGIV
jgi:predicted amidohydrolase YtcJ